jgi:hypothetical protein
VWDEQFYALQAHRSLFKKGITDLTRKEIAVTGTSKPVIFIRLTLGRRYTSVNIKPEPRQQCLKTSLMLPVRWTLREESLPRLLICFSFWVAPAEEGTHLVGPKAEEAGEQKWKQLDSRGIFFLSRSAGRKLHCYMQGLNERPLSFRVPGTHGTKKLE